MKRKMEFTAWSSKQARKYLKTTYPKLVKTHKIKTLDPPHQSVGLGSAGTYKIVKRKKKKK